MIDIDIESLWVNQSAAEGANVAKRERARIAPIVSPSLPPRYKVTLRAILLHGFDAG